MAKPRDSITPCLSLSPFAPHFAQICLLLSPPPFLATPKGSVPSRVLCGGETCKPKDETKKNYRNTRRKVASLCLSGFSLGGKRGSQRCSPEYSRKQKAQIDTIPKARLTLPPKVKTKKHRLQKQHNRDQEKKKKSWK